MNSRLFQFQYSYEREIVKIYARIAIGASGAPTIVTTGSSASSVGIISVTRNSAGTYTLVLKDAFMRIMQLHSLFLVNGDPAAPLVNLMLDNTAAASKSLKIQCNAVDGTTATDPASGEIMLLEITLKNASTAT